MLGFVIGDNDMITGFRLVGLEGQEVTSLQEARTALSSASKRRDVAIVIISEEFSNQIRQDIDKIRQEHITPLILEVPGRKGPSGETKLSDLVSKTLGIRV